MKLLLLLLLSVLFPLAWCQCVPGKDCLTLFRTLTDVDSAEGKCLSIGGNLVSIHTAIDNAEVANLVSQHGDPGDSYWIGLEGEKQKTDTAVHDYQWYDDTPYDWNNFKISNPKGTGRMCTQWCSGVWTAIPCDGNTAQFICLVKASANPTPTPTTAPITTPTTTPTTTTTTVRITTTTKPTDNCPFGYFWYEPTNMCYKLRTDKANFENAKRSCEENGDVLASIHSQDQQDYLARHTTGNTYIGLVYDTPTSRWKWLDGSPFDYYDWFPGQPDNMNKEFWVEINITKFREMWNNITPGNVNLFYCQKPNPPRR